MIRRRKAGTRALVIGLTVAAVACGSAAAAMPGYWLRVHAQLAPVAGTKAAGKFDGVLVQSGAGKVLQLRTLTPSPTGYWWLTWKLGFPPLRGRRTASLRIRGPNGAPTVTRVLCTPCRATANGTIKMTAAQAIGLAGGHGVVVVQSRSGRLRGAVKSFEHPSN